MAISVEWGLSFDWRITVLAVFRPFSSLWGASKQPSTGSMIAFHKKIRLRLYARVELLLAGNFQLMFWIEIRFEGQELFARWSFWVRICSIPIQLRGMNLGPMAVQWRSKWGACDFIRRMIPARRHPFECIWLLQKMPEPCLMDENNKITTDKVELWHATLPCRLKSPSKPLVEWTLRIAYCMQPEDLLE